MKQLIIFFFLLLSILFTYNAMAYNIGNPNSNIKIVEYSDY